MTNQRKEIARGFDYGHPWPNPMEFVFVGGGATLHVEKEQIATTPGNHAC